MQNRISDIVYKNIMLSLTASQIAEKIAARVEGDAQILLNRLAALDAANEGDLSFLANKKYETQLIPAALRCDCAGGF
ncbi:MAG: hypothetical protein R3B47_04650 [Bacteroidia bacterium]